MDDVFLDISGHTMIGRRQNFMLFVGWLSEQADGFQVKNAGVRNG